MAALPTQTLAVAGTAPTFGATSASDTAEIGNGSNTFAVYRNSTGSPIVVTAVQPGNDDYGTAKADPTFSVAASGGERWIPLRKSLDDGTGRATLTGGGDVGLTVAVVRVA
ncbi:hypothetical protein [Nocardia nova]|uniref:hypothetical protein n=1 Tax=Nocardia nova TaxID=37330 RepID=UPI002738F690|nr:hypothetical protein [Nocardia nova]